MSGKPKPLVVQVLQRSATEGIDRLVLCAYAFFGNPDGTSITAKAETVAKRAGLPVEIVKKSRPRLLDLGELEVVARGPRGVHLAYRIVLPRQLRVVGDPARPGSPPGSSKKRRSIGDPPEDPGEKTPLSVEVGRAGERPSPLGDLRRGRR